jgi:hypothetical protein
VPSWTARDGHCILPAASRDASQPGSFPRADGAGRGEPARRSRRFSIHLCLTSCRRSSLATIILDGTLSDLNHKLADLNHKLSDLNHRLSDLKHKLADLNHKPADLKKKACGSTSWPVSTGMGSSTTRRRGVQREERCNDGH